MQSTFNVFEIKRSMQRRGVDGAKLWHERFPKQVSLRLSLNLILIILKGLHFYTVDFSFHI